MWRYYLLTNRPEVSCVDEAYGDSSLIHLQKIMDLLSFGFRHFVYTSRLQAKLNTELLNNLGNFINRVLSFIAKPPGQQAACRHQIFLVPHPDSVWQVSRFNLLKDFDMKRLGSGCRDFPWVPAILFFICHLLTVWCCLFLVSMVKFEYGLVNDTSRFWSKNYFLKFIYIFYHWNLKILAR